MSLATLVDARLLWPDADTLSDELLQQLLDVATERCEAYLPETLLDPYPVVIPLPWSTACILDARDVWTASRRDGDVIGFDTYAVRVRPLSDTVKGLLRPRRGRPLVG